MYDDALMLSETEFYQLWAHAVEMKREMYDWWNIAHSL